jgi:hypothetical protein
MRSIALTICGNRYEISLDEELASFVEEDLMLCDIHLDQDNKADKLLQAYLKMAKQTYEYEAKITNILQKLES